MFPANFASQTELSPPRQFAQVTQQIGPNQIGRIRFQATYWRAKFASSNPESVAKPNTTVQVIGREGLILIVMPINN